MLRAAFSALALASLLLLTACERQAGWHATDITGVMPALDFATMQRADDGKMVTAADYRGKVVALFFGYSNCPDVCPLTLANLAEATARLGAKAGGVRVLFVSVDPDRDTPARLKAYAGAFAPQVDALRGSANAIADTARRYRVAYSVTKGPPYEVSHSGAVFFFDATGRVRLVTTRTDDIDGMAADLARLLG